MAREQKVRERCLVEERYTERELTTPPPPRRELLAALTMVVTSRSVIDVRIKATFELRAVEGSGVEISDGGGWSVEDL